MTVLGVETVIHQIELSDKHNKNVLVVGAAGRGKNFSYIRPNILLDQEKSLLIVDPHKKEFTYTHNEKLEQGYRILNYDLSSETIFEDFRNDLNSYGSDKLAIYLNNSNVFSAFLTEITAKEHGLLVQELFGILLNDEVWNQSLHIIFDDYELYPLPDMAKFLSNTMAHNIGVSIILQELNVLKRIYEKEFASIIEKCEAILYFGGRSVQEAEFLIRLGESKSVSTTNESSIKKHFITVEKMLHMKHNEAFLIVNGERAKIINKLFTEDLTTQKKIDYWNVATEQLLEMLHDYAVQETNVEVFSIEALLKVKELLNTMNSAEDLEKITSALESSNSSKIAWVACKPREEYLIKSVIESAKTKVESIIM